MSERLKEPVLKTGDAQASVGSNPTLSATFLFVRQSVVRYLQKYPSGRRGSPAKGVGRETVARVQIPPSAPTRKPRTAMVPGFFFYLFDWKNPLLYPLQVQNVLDIGFHAGGALPFHLVGDVPIS